MLNIYNNNRLRHVRLGPDDPQPNRAPVRGKQEGDRENRDDTENADRKIVQLETPLSRILRAAFGVAP